jgi:hypothetical protein
MRRREVMPLVIDGRQRRERRNGVHHRNLAQPEQEQGCSQQCAQTKAGGKKIT